MAASIIDLTEELLARGYLAFIRPSLAVAQPECLRQTLLDLCMSRHTAQRASAILLVAEDKAVSVHDSDEESNRSGVESENSDSGAGVTEPRSATVDKTPTAQASNGIKRLPPRYAIWHRL